MALELFEYSLFPGVGDLKVRLGDAAPTSGTWGVGDMVINSAPAAGRPFVWVCVTAGTPGTWQPLSTTPTSATTTQATIGAIAAGSQFLTLTSNAAGTYTLPKANSYSPGQRLSLVVTNNVATTFAAASGDQVNGTAAVTAANAPVEFVSDSVTQWYRI